jgi:site-specific DNA-methyltransferase (adenine-specific)
MLGRLKFEIDPLVEEMLDRIPEEMFVSDTKTFLDPAMGGGQFIKGLISRLRKYSHSDDNIASRITGYENNKMRIQFAVNKYNLIGTFEVKDFLEKEYEEDEDMKFDVILGNPPFESATVDGRKDQANNLWSKFTKKAFDLVKEDGIVSFVTPTSWLSPAADIGKGDNGIKFVRDYFQKLSVTHLNVNECAKHFDVGSTFSYFVVQNTQSNECTTRVVTDGEVYNIDLRDISFFPKTMSSVGISINNKILTNTEKFGIIGNNLPESKLEMVKQETDEYNVPCYHTNAKGGTYWYSKSPISTCKKRKVIFSISGEFTPIYDDVGELSFTGMCCAYYLNDNDTMDSIKSFLESKLITFLLKENKYTGWVSPVTRDLPNLDKTKVWTNEELYTHFELTQPEVDYIEENVK